MTSEPSTPDDDPDTATDTASDVAAPDASPEDVDSAFEIDLDPEDQGLAGSGEEPSG